MDESILVESIKYSAPCQGCGAEAEWCGVQALVDKALRWDVESTWPTCGFALAVCGGDPPEELRGRLLSEHGRGRLQVAPPTRNAAIMRVSPASTASQCNPGAPTTRRGCPYRRPDAAPHAGGLGAGAFEG